ncbi:MAG: hypothetical protein ACK4YF_06200 [Exilispira sp.]
MVYQIYSDHKNAIIENILNSKKIRYPAILIAGPDGVGKRITAYHIIKKILDLNSCLNIFYQKNFCYLSKNYPFEELSFLIYEIMKTDNFLVDKKIAFEKLKFIVARFLSTFVYRISEIDEKSIDSSFYEDASFLFYKLKNIRIEDKEDLDLIINLCNNIILNKKAFKSDRIYISEIKNIQKWIEYTYQFENRIILIDNIELMQDESANSFLKTLEEPDNNLIFILTSSSKASILPTILSRCVIYEIDRIKEDELKNILENEWKINFSIFGNQKISSFYDLFTLLKKDINKFLKSIREIFELFFLETNKYNIFIENLLSQNDYPFFLKQLILFSESILSSYQNNKKVILENISLEKLIRLNFYLNKIEEFSKNYNYPIDNALIFAYLNRKQILNGDFLGEKIVL